MHALAPEFVQLIGQFPLGFVATLSPDGFARVSPKGTFLVLDDTRIAFGNIRSPGTLRNLRENNNCEVNFVDPFTRKGVRIQAKATIHTHATQEFDALISNWRDMWGDLSNRISDLVVLNITKITPLTTPPYDEGANDDDMIALYKQKYAEIYP